MTLTRKMENGLYLPAISANYMGRIGFTTLYYIG